MDVKNHCGDKRFSSGFLHSIWSNINILQRAFTKKNSTSRCYRSDFLASIKESIKGIRIDPLDIRWDYGGLSRTKQAFIEPDLPDIQTDSRKLQIWFGVQSDFYGWIQDSKDSFADNIKDDNVKDGRLWISKKYQEWLGLVVEDVDKTRKQQLIT